VDDLAADKGEALTTTTLFLNHYDETITALLVL
jgi:hypothetical protein